MQRRSVLVLALAVIGTLGAAGDSHAGKFTPGINIGDKGPSWVDLIGTDDKRHDLDEYKDAKLVVVIFITNSCPESSH